MVCTKRKRGGTKSESESGRNDRGERTRAQSDDERVGRNERTRKESDDDRQRTGRRSRYESDQERHFNERRSKSESERSARRKRPPPARTWRQWAVHHKNKFIGVAAIAALLATGAWMNPAIMGSPSAAYTYIATNFPAYAGIAKANILGIYARASGILSKPGENAGETVSMPTQPEYNGPLTRKAYNAQKGLYDKAAKLMHKGTKHGSRAAYSGLMNYGKFITDAATNLAIYKAKETADKAIKYGINTIHDEILETGLGEETANGINNSVPAGVVLTHADRFAASAHMRQHLPNTQYYESNPTTQSGQMAVYQPNIYH